MALPQMVESLRAAGETVVSSLGEMEALVRQVKDGEKVRGGVYVIAGSLEISEAYAMFDLIELLQERYGVTCPRSPRANAMVDQMWQLDAHLRDIETHIDLLIQITDRIKEDVRVFEEVERSSRLKYFNAKKKRGPIRRQHERTLMAAQEARVRAFNTEAGTFKMLVTMACKADRRYKVGDKMNREIWDFNIKMMHLVGICMSGERDTSWVIRTLENLNESRIPKLRNSSVEFDPPNVS